MGSHNLLENEVFADVSWWTPRKPRDYQNQVSSESVSRKVMLRGIVFWFISVCESSSHICIQTPQINVNSMFYRLHCMWKHFARNRHSCNGLKGWEGRPRKSSSVRS